MSVRIKDLATTATSPAADDYIAIDGATNGTRKIPAGDIGGGGTSDDITNESAVSGETVTGALNSLSDQIANLSGGAPTPAATVSDMVDTSKIYLYTGSESGYTAGHWYYYSDGAWTDGGAYGEAASMSAGVKAALLACFRQVAWIGDDGQDYYNNLYNELYPPANLVGITVVYTQSGTVYDTASLDDLKPDLVVTANYSDGTSEVVTTYTLSGTLAVGTSTVTVAYGNYTDTFTVAVSSAPAQPLYNWDFTTESLVDTVSGVTATINTQYDYSSIDSSGVHITGSGGYCNFGNILTEDNMTIEVDFGTFDRQGTGHGRCIMISSNGNINDGQGFIYRSTGAWSTYFSGSWGEATSYTNVNAFSNETITVKKTPTTIGFYLGDTLIQERTVTTGSYLMIGANPNAFYNVDVKAVRIYRGV